MTGYVRIYRSGGEHHFRDKLDQALFRDLVAEAFWRDGGLWFKGKRINLKRGQMVLSLRDYAAQWGFSVKWLRGRLEHLESERVIERAQHGAHGPTVITICNYDKYQVNPQQQGTPKGTGRTQAGHTEGTQEKEGEEVKEDVDVAERARRVDEIGAEVLRRLGADPRDPRWYGNYAPIYQWLADGADPEMDIYPVAERIGRQRNREPPNTLNYLTKAIADHRATRLAPMPEGKPDERKPSNVSGFVQLLNEEYGG